LFNNQRKREHRGDGNGISWPHADTSTPMNIEDIFGARPFSVHTVSVGYNYDFHRGIDIQLPQGSTVYSPINGSVIRNHFTHYGWESNTQFIQWTEVDASSSFAYSLVPGAMGQGGLAITGSRTGSQDFPAGVSYIKPIKERVIIQHGTDPWVMEVQFSAPFSVTGAFGMGLLDTLVTSSEYTAIEYDGYVHRIIGRDADGAFVKHNTVVTASGHQSWMRMTYKPSTTSISYSYATGGGTVWTDMAIETTTNFTNKTVATFIPVLYWRSIDSNAALQYITLSASNWYDAEQISRFGNWVEIGDASKRALVYHLQEPLVNRGQFVHAGQAIGTVGSTGFNDRSGRVLTSHIHLEMIPNNNYIYSNDEPLNPISSVYLPLSHSNTNISGTITSENDPNAVASHKLSLVVSRSNQELNLNSVSLTGDSATRTINFNARTGLNSDDFDIPFASGVYIVPQAFSASSATYDIAIYFNKSVVGNTFVSYTVLNTDGITVTSG